jgi:hypothetical protein
MSNHYYLPINVNRNDVVKPSWVRPTEYITTRDKDYAKDMLTEEFYEKLTSIDEISLVMIFNQLKNYYPMMAHVDLGMPDGEPVETHVGLNIVFDDSTDSKGTMRWYSPKDSSKEKKVAFTPTKTAYLNYMTNQLNLEAEYCIADLVTLVRTNVPHAVSAGNKPRTCISLRFASNMDWETAVEKFNKTFNHTS